MTQSETNKLYKSIAADFKIIVRKTGLMKLDYCEQILNDIKILMQNDYVRKISLILDKPKGTPIKVKQYIIIPTTRINNDRPGENDWEEEDGEYLHLTLSYTALWGNLTEEEKNNFRKQNLKINWVPSNIDTSFNNLKKQSAKQYSTGLNGADRIDYN